MKGEERIRGYICSCVLVSKGEPVAEAVCGEEAAGASELDCVFSTGEEGGDEAEKIITGGGSEAKEGRRGSS